YSWGTDSVFYEAQVLELEGADAAEARRQAIAVYAGAGASEDELRPFRNERWVSESARNYRRRWAVPVAAAAASPIFGDRSLLLVSLAGYVATGIALFALLRRRFGQLPSMAAA